MLTGTLALGINAPTRTSVFCGDSPYLTALMVSEPPDDAHIRLRRLSSTGNVQVAPDGAGSTHWARSFSTVSLWIVSTV